MKTNTDLYTDVLQDLIKHEGAVFKVYADSEGLLTFGIGHLITKDDEEYGMPLGTPVDEDRVMECFEADVDDAIEDCLNVFHAFDTYPHDVQRVLINMMFNLGRTRFMKFKRMIAAVEEQDWKLAASEMRDSKWYRQVKGRAKELEELMRNA